MIRYSDHAIRRMADRRITADDVDQALRQRLDPRPGEPGTLWIHGYTQGGRVLKVCVNAADQEFIITVVWRDE